MRRYSLFALLFGLLLVTSCTQAPKEYRLAAGNDGISNYEAGELISKQLERTSGIKLQILDSCFGTIDNIERLLENKADFAIVQNTLDYNRLGYSEDEIDATVKTVIPLYKQILYIIYSDTIHNDDLFKLVKGKRVGVGPKDEGTDWLVIDLLSYFGLTPDDYTLVYTSNADNIVNENIDISCSITSFNNKRIIKMMKQDNLRLFSFDQLSNFEIGGSTVNGVSIKNTTLSPCIIPKYSYSNKPLYPVLTISTNGVLICRADIDEDVIYDITQNIIDNKSIIVNINPIFNVINEEYYTSNHRFPLHSGVKMYLDRAKPSFLVRYAEVIALMLSIAAVLFGALSSLNQWQRRRKKDRIDVYYQYVIDIDKKITEATNKETLIKLESELLAIRDKAFDLLIREKLIADESFNIFLRVLEHALKRIHDFCEAKFHE